MTLTVQKLANICNHAWELQRELGFHMQGPTNFKKLIAEMPDAQLRNLMENMGLLFSEIRDLGAAPISLKSEGTDEAPKKDA